MSICINILQRNCRSCGRNSTQRGFIVLGAPRWRVKCPRVPACSWARQGLRTARRVPSGVGFRNRQNCSCRFPHDQSRSFSKCVDHFFQTVAQQGQHLRWKTVAHMARKTVAVLLSCNTRYVAVLIIHVSWISNNHFLRTVSKPLIIPPLIL